MNNPDIDIDVKDRLEALKGHVYTSASIVVDGDLKKHNTGVFFQKVPVDPITGYCSLPSGKRSGDRASEAGFMKVDFIPNHAYELVESPEHMDDLLDKEIDWTLFDREDVVKKLQQLGNHHEIVYAYQPQSIADLACLIALIRPGKMHLIGEEWDVIREEIWKPQADGSYSYKKSHAVAFAMCIVVQLQSMIEAGEIE